MERRAALRLTRRYAASPDEVWRVLTEPESLARWLHGDARLDVEPGGAFALGSTITGRVTQLDAGRVLELTWQTCGEEESLVRFELHPGEEGTLLVLDHTRLDQRTCMAYGREWTRSIARLDVELTEAQP